MINRDDLTIDRELEMIKEKVQLVEEAGFGEVIIQIQRGKVVYISYRIGEEVSTK